jgi:hypothetical protein
MSEEIRVSETNAATGETVVRVLEGAELEAFLADRAAMQAEQEAREAAAAEKAVAKAAILERLGLTEEELATVLS